jgi:maltose O-acetyltransferase
VILPRLRIGRRIEQQTGPLATRVRDRTLALGCVEACQFIRAAVEEAVVSVTETAEDAAPSSTPLPPGDEQDAEPTTMSSEREKMLAGELYDPMDPELVRARARARDLCQDLNATRERDEARRRQILGALFGAGGDSVWMQPPFYCDYGSNITLGERVFFNFNCIVLDVCPVRIGSFTLFGPAVQLYTAMHPMDALERRAREFGKPIEIGSDVWVGGGAIILAGVRIGSGSVIGAGSVVTRDVPDGVLAAGNPCRVIRPVQA